MPSVVGNSMSWGSETKPSGSRCDDEHASMTASEEGSAAVAEEGVAPAGGTRHR